MRVRRVPRQKLRRLKPQSVQCDELWSFVHAKQRNVVNLEKPVAGAGDYWTWLALTDRKLVILYLIGPRSPESAATFMADLADRVTNLIQISTDGLTSYPDAVYEAFGTYVDYGQVIKVYKAERPDHAHYSPASCIGCKKQHVIGCPEPSRITTSHSERLNLSLRTQQKRYARLTNGHSKKLENHGHATSLYVVFYNYCRPHQALDGKTPSQASGLADHKWSIDELAGLVC